jgi:hypothetical protein
MKVTPLQKVTNRLESQIGEALAALKEHQGEILAAPKIAEAIIEAIQKMILDPSLYLGDKQLD